VVVTESTIYHTGSSNSSEIRAQLIPSDPNPVIINRTLLDQFKNQLLNHPVIKNRLYLYVAISFAAIFLFIGQLILYSLTIFLYSLVAWVISAIFVHRPELNFSKISQLSLHSYTPVLLATLLTRFFHLAIPSLVVFLTYLAWTFLGISYIQFPKAKAEK
jgi:hypothetical protein